MMEKITKLTYYEFSSNRKCIMGIASILIMVFHLTTYCVIPKNIFTSVMYDFNIGVEIFLLMSGIGLYFSFSNKNVSFKNYYIKRILNVYLIFLIINLPTALYESIVISRFNILSFLLNWTGANFWLGISRTGWYVSFAMILYLFYPLIFRVLKWGKRGVDLILTIGGCALCLLLCFVLKHFCPDVFSIIEIALLRIPAFFIGCYLGKLVYNKERITWRLYLVSFLGIVIWFLIKIYGGTNTIYLRLSHCLLSVTICLFVIIASNLIRIKPLFKTMEFLGAMSLELYLIHFAIFVVLCGDSGDRNKVSLVVYAIVIAATIPLSILVSRLRVTIINAYNKKIMIDKSS